MLRWVFKESYVFLVFQGVEAVGVMSAAQGIFVFLTSKSAPFVRAHVILAKLRILSQVQGTVLRVFTAEHRSVDVPVRGAVDVVKRPARK